MLLGVDSQKTGYSGEAALQGAKGVPESYIGQQMENVTQDSLVSIEKQCNKMCIRRMLSAYAHVQGMIQTDVNQQ